MTVGFKLVKFINRQFIRRLNQDLYEKYGSKGAWAVVTGGSDGIGLCMCHKLAAQGFNICIVARNEEKMKEKLAEIKKGVKNDI